MEEKKIMFACVRNAGRSQIAASLFNSIKKDSIVKGLSAGSNPGSEVHKVVVEVMREVGINLEGIKPRKLTDDLAKDASIIVTMGCGESTPKFPGVKVIEWQIPDPKDEPIEIAREIRELIRSKVVELINNEGF